ncbi:MAG: aminotransferase class V-fold PLP-dependent enzyme [Bacteroidales bacterium]
MQNLTMMEEKFWEEIREQFPVTDHLAYFQSAGMSPMPRRVFEATRQALEQIMLMGDANFLADLNRADALRQKLGAMIGAEADDIAFVPNTSTAFSLIAASLKAAHPAPFNLVSLMDEFPSSNIPFEYQGIPVKFVKPLQGRYTPESILEACDDQTLGVVCSQVQYASGFRLDVAGLGAMLQSKGLLFIVNATQAFPVFEVDVQKMHIDVLAVSFHKWGLAGITGSMLFTRASFRQSFPNPMAGWLSVMPPPDDFIPTQKNVAYRQFRHAGQYNFGTQNIQALAGLDAAMDFVEHIGRERIRKRILEISAYLVKELALLPAEVVSPVQTDDERSGIVLVNLQKGSNAEAVEFLARNNVITSLRMGKIRISCNFFNNRSDVDRLIKVLDLFCQI